MAKNITLKIDEELLKLCRFEAVESDKSLSQWVADVLKEHVKSMEDYQLARGRARRRIAEGLSLGGNPISRESIHER